MYVICESGEIWYVDGPDSECAALRCSSDSSFICISPSVGRFSNDHTPDPIPLSHITTPPRSASPSTRFSSFRSPSPAHPSPSIKLSSLPSLPLISSITFLTAAYSPGRSTAALRRAERGVTGSFPFERDDLDFDFEFEAEKVGGVLVSEEREER